MQQHVEELHRLVQLISQKPSAAGVASIVVVVIVTVWWRQRQQLQQRRRRRKKTKHPRQKNSDEYTEYTEYTEPQLIHRTHEHGSAIPLLGHAITFLKHPPWDVLTSWHRTYSSGVLQFFILRTQFFSIANPFIIKQLLQTQISVVEKDIRNTMSTFLCLLGTGIVSSHGAHWLQQRVQMSTVLKQTILQSVPYRTLVSIQHLFRTFDDSDKIPLGQSLRHLTLQVISNLFLSISIHESNTVFANLYLPIVDECNIRVWYPYRKYNILHPRFYLHLYHVYSLNTYVSTIIQKRWTTKYTTAKNRTTASDDDLLDHMLQSYRRKSPAPTPERLPKAVVRQIRDEIKTFVLAGHETSAAMMTWCVYEILLQQHSKDSSLLTKLRAEADTVFTNDDPIDWSTVSLDDAGVMPDFQKYANLQLSEACLREALRKYSVVPIVGRRLVDDMYIDVPIEDGDDTKYEHVFLPKGSSVMINIQAVHLNEKHWANPMQFDPYRFLNADTKTAASENPYTYLPFIAGPRNCLGQYLALLESKIVLSLLLQQYDITFEGMDRIDPTDWSTDPRHPYMIPSIPKQELMVTVTKRKIT